MIIYGGFVLCICGIGVYRIMNIFPKSNTPEVRSRGGGNPDETVSLFDNSFVVPITDSDAAKRTTNLHSTNKFRVE